MKRFIILLLVIFGFENLSATQPTKITEPNHSTQNEVADSTYYETWFEYASDLHPDYCFELGAIVQSTKIDGVYTIPVSKLYFKGELVDEHINTELVHYGYTCLDEENPHLKVKGVDELFIVYSSGEFCGAGIARILMGRKGNQLIKEIVVEDIYAGEGVIDGFFLEQRFDVKHDRLVLDIKKGFHFAEQSPQVIKNYYHVVQPYKLVSNEFLALEKKVKKELYVKSSRGLNARSEPFLTAPKAGKIGYAKKVKVLRETDLTLSILDNGKEVIGRWLEIENDLHENGLPLYVFDAYLTSKPPE